jgi:hypothetical protein
MLDRELSQALGLRTGDDDGVGQKLGVERTELCGLLGRDKPDPEGVGGQKALWKNHQLCALLRRLGYLRIGNVGLGEIRGNRRNGISVCNPEQSFSTIDPGAWRFPPPPIPAQDFPKSDRSWILGLNPSAHVQRFRISGRVATSGWQPDAGQG